jgi:CDP-diacylglycerol--glycerol-3-phosphate 3-phosphatidyltransferase
MERARERRRMKKKHLLGPANYLTYGRIASIPVILMLMSLVSPAHEIPSRNDLIINWVAFGLFIISSITDVIDGYIARRYESTGSFGKFLDPLADKLVTSAILIMLIPMGRLSAWVPIILISREIAITALRGMAISEGIVIAASKWGKRKSVIETFALGALLIHYNFWGLNFNGIGQVLIWMTIIISIGSGIHYMWRFFQEVLERKKTPLSD